MTDFKIKMGAGTGQPPPEAGSQDPLERHYISKQLSAKLIYLKNHLLSSEIMEILLEVQGPTEKPKLLLSCNLPTVLFVL